MCAKLKRESESQPQLWVSFEKPQTYIPPSYRSVLTALAGRIAQIQSEQAKEALWPPCEWQDCLWVGSCWTQGDDASFHLL